MDSLDRTNVAQAAIARWTLDLQLKAAGILGEKDGVDQQQDIDVALRESTETVLILPCPVLIMTTFQCGRTTPISLPEHTQGPGL